MNGFRKAVPGIYKITTKSVSSDTVFAPVAIIEFWLDVDGADWLTEVNGAIEEVSLDHTKGVARLPSYPFYVDIRLLMPYQRTAVNALELIKAKLPRVL